MTFRVPSVVPEDSEWGRAGLVGYSSVGYLAPGPAMSDKDLVVPCVAADDVVGDTSNVGFIKLDLQGGELGALQGMRRILPNVRLMWVEFTMQPGLLQFLGCQGFTIYDTEYMMFGEPTSEASRVFDVTHKGVRLSTGAAAWYGFRRLPWPNYENGFEVARRQHGLVQTDLVCVNSSHLDEFIASLQHV